MTLRERRVRLGLRQEDVAERISVDQTTVSLWETGKSVPIRVFRGKLAELYGCTVEELLDGNGPPKKDARKELRA